MAEGDQQTGCPRVGRAVREDVGDGVLEPVRLLGGRIRGIVAILGSRRHAGGLVAGRLADRVDGVRLVIAGTPHSGLLLIGGVVPVRAILLPRRLLTPLAGIGITLLARRVPFLANLGVGVLGIRLGDRDPLLAAGRRGLPLARGDLSHRGQWSSDGQPRRRDEPDGQERGEEGEDSPGCLHGVLIGGGGLVLERHAHIRRIP
jgi:hypothetical protein